jgi:hypothetical protein
MNLSAMSSEVETSLDCLPVGYREIPRLRFALLGMTTGLEEAIIEV